MSRYKTPEQKKAHCEAQRRYKERHPDKAYAPKRGNWVLNRDNYARRNPEKFKAHKTLERAVRRGNIIRPNSCVKCLRPCKPQAHHTDYSKPLFVMWLCRPCHLQEHGCKVRNYREGDPRP